MVLNPDVDNSILDTVYDHIAGYLVQLSMLDFTAIGAISEDYHDSNTWSVTGRPLTYNMNELATVSGYPTGSFLQLSSCLQKNTSRILQIST
jgi:hypothetical protein